MLRQAVQSVRHCTRHLLASSREAPLINMEQVRTTVIMEQEFPPRLAKKGYLPKVKLKNRILRMVDRTHDQRTPDITCIMTDFVDGVGMRGDVVTVKRRLFRNRLQPAGLAVYASPENMEKFAKEKKEKGIVDEEKLLGVFGEMTLRQLSGLYLRVPMSGDHPWVLSPKHVRIALRKTGIEAKEHCITLPQHPITGPEEFSFSITINGVKSTMAKGRVVLRFNDPSKNELPELPPTWNPPKKTTQET
ncbi:large ribosomal subunit protein bL9m-like [Babylonia areolata]|uniref:large ribosomal subunit protein bL9m-like n=1 Tax=Babylonia areolata TaxID=304850 RepID=UPI003FD1D38B